MNQGCENAVDKDFEKREWESLTYEEKNRLLFLRQKRLFDTFLERISLRLSMKKSLHDLTSRWEPLSRQANRKGYRKDGPKCVDL